MVNGSEEEVVALAAQGSFGRGSCSGRSRCKGRAEEEDDEEEEEEG
jgi:hypothetical protein